ncbi:MAG: 16S rRNA (cytosine(967)-C(5))-methyltransferase RsmB [Angelakisella sp.]
MSRTAREAAAQALLAVSQDGGYSNLVLDNILEKEDLSPADRSFCAALFYTAMQRMLTLDHAIAAYSSQPLKKLSPEVLTALRCGFCQLLFLNVPESAAVNETVKLVKSLGEERAAGFVNAVLRSFLRAGCAVPVPKDKLTALSVQYSVPMPLIQLWRKGYGHQTAVDILEGMEDAPPLFLRGNTTKTTLEALVKTLAAEGCTAQLVPEVPNALRVYAPGGVARLPSFAKGLYHVQDLSSQRCVLAAGIAPGMRVLDLCAAPGGKSFTAAQQLQGRGELLACDLYDHRLMLVEAGARRLGLQNSITTRQNDATQPNPSLGLFDRVLCDVVCSGFGTLRRKPEIRYKPLETLDDLPAIQYNILDSAFVYLGVGGRLIYSTCTLNPAENDQVIKRLLDTRSDVALCGAPITIFPTRDGGDGFFYAVLEKR